jgi:hypothetical protein
VTGNVFEQLAAKALFTGLSALDIEAAGFTYRKGKTFEDVKAAITSGVKAGHGKTEAEIAMVGVKLARVLLHRKVAK